MRFRCLLMLAAVCCLASIGCHNPAGKGQKKIEPAQVAHPVSESQLNTITLTPEATQRLGVEIGEITRKTVARMRTVGGEVVLPTGKTTIVSAPLAERWPLRKTESCLCQAAKWNKAGRSSSSLHC